MEGALASHIEELSQANKRGARGFPRLLLRHTSLLALIKLGSPKTRSGASISIKRWAY